ncbi:MAG: DUF2007 domain-containing protein [Dysgonamonadaceae bacterium]|jgi:hypothetical protein|nr:DUF2007 domain-containing protein [Dysgonamonadaceae bacterium]
MEELVTVRTFFDTAQMAVPKSLLESEGIECFVQGEFMGQFHPAVNAADGLKLQVKEEDVKRAIDILKEGGFLTEKDLKPSKLYNVIGRLLDKFKKK